MHQAGLDRISIGIESGSDTVLSYQRKGVSAKHQLLALQKLEKAGIRYTTYIMVGLGGQAWSEENAIKTAEFLNQVHPDEMTLVTMVVFKGADLVRAIRSGEFKRLSARQAVEEERLLLSHLELNTIFNGTHPTNPVSIKGKIPLQKDYLLKKLDAALEAHDEKEMEDLVMHKWKTL